MIVECGIERFDVEPSQGTHFFQNVTSLGVGYLTINPFRGDGIFREDLLDARKASTKAPTCARALRPPAVGLRGRPFEPGNGPRNGPRGGGA